MKKMLKTIIKIYQKNKEVLLYLFFGGIAFFLNIGLFILFYNLMGINELIANILSWMICVSFQFFTNRKFVFEATNNSNFFWQLGSFFGGRLFTLLFEEVILAIFVTWLSCNSTIVKLLLSVVVIVLNYIISKLIVFKKNKARVDCQQ